MFKIKKAFALILMLALFIPALARASSNGDYNITTATIGDKDAAGDYRIWVTNDGIEHYAQDTGIHFPYLNPASTDQTLTAAQSGTVLVINNLAGTYVNGATFTLPSAVPKLKYTFVIDVAKIFRLKPASGEIINFSTDIANSKVKNTSSAIGDSITVFCSTAGQWSVTEHFGTWATDNNP